MTPEEMKKKGRRNSYASGILMTCMSVITVLMFSMPVGALTQSPPYAIGSAGCTDAGTPGYGYVDHYVVPWARYSDGHFGSETAPNFRGVGLSGAYRQCTASMSFNGPNFNPASTKSYLIVATWNFNWHQRLKMWGGFGTPCSGYARCDIDVKMNVYSVTHSQWLTGDLVIHIADHTRTAVGNYEISYEGSMGSTGTYWNLETGHQYYCMAKVTCFGYLYSGTYPTYVSEAWARNDIWRSGDATLVSFTIT